MASFFSRLAPAEAISIACYHCGSRQEVGRKAQTVTCRHCHKALQVSDVQVKRYDGRREVRTVGTLTVEKKGQVVADRVECGGLVARGQVKAKHATTVRGIALVGPRAQLIGTVEAYSMSVTEGAEINGYLCVGKDHMTPPMPAPAVDEESVNDEYPDPGAIDTPEPAPGVPEPLGV